MAGLFTRVVWGQTTLELCPRCLAYNNLRTFSSHSPNSPQPEVKPPSTMRAYIVRKYVDYITRFDATFERSYPKVYKVYRLFKDGVHEFFIDTRTYYSVATDIWSGKPLRSFTRKELETYKQMPKDMLRSAPVLLSIPLPLMPYLVFPVAYMYPRHLLCRHFWTSDQRLEFSLHDLHRHQFPHYGKILKYMHAHTGSIRDPGRRKVFADILSQISNNVQPEVDAILDVQELFAKYPFGYNHLLRRHKIHLYHLCRGLGVSTRQSRLHQDLTLFHQIDLAIHREGVRSLSLSELQQACFMRGLNAVNVTEEDLQHYLKDWVQISASINELSVESLLLHRPVLLSTTWPSNAKYLHTTVKS